MNKVIILLVVLAVLFSGCAKGQVPLEKKRKIVNRLSSDLKIMIKDKGSNYSKVQRDFLKKNKKTISNLMQRNLKYPDFSVKFREEGINVVQFTLAPELLVKNIQIIKSSGYERLDKNTIKTVEKSRMQFPRPEVETQVIIYVLYELSM